MSRARDAAGSFDRPYNLKIGPIAFTAGLSFDTEFIDNVNLSPDKAEADIVLRPALNIAAVWQVTKLNSLEIQTGLGYTKYLSHPELDTQSVTVSPNSEIRMNIFIGDVKLVLHEQFSLQEDPVTQGGVSGVAKFGRFTNTIGATALWDLNDVVWSLGYDHYNLITTGDTATTNGSSNANVSTLDRATDQISSAVFLKLSATTGLGIEGTAAYSQYPNNPRADSTSFSIGPFIDYQFTAYTRLALSAGYQTYSSQNGDSPAATPQFLNNTGITGIGGFGATPTTGGSTSGNRANGDGNSYYANLSVTHRLNRFYTDQLAAGREFQIGLLGDRTQTTFFSYGASFLLSRRITLSGALSYQMVHQTSQFQSAFGATLPDYDQFLASLSTSYQLTRKLSVGISYQIAKRITDLTTQDYTQNRVMLQFGYQF